jgi:large-conductance mechanosensitive channel
MPTKKNQKDAQTRVATSGNTVRVEAPKNKQGRKPRVSVIVGPDVFVGGFVGFLREHAVVGLAVGFVIGAQVQTVVKQLIASFIDPLFQLLLGHNLSTTTFTWHFHGRHANFGWGSFVYILLDFLFVLVAVYAVIRIFKLEEFDKPQ